MKTRNHLFATFFAVFLFCFLFVAILGFYYLRIKHYRSSIYQTHVSIKQLGEIGAEVNYLESSLLQINNNNEINTKRKAIYHLNHTEQLINNLQFSNTFSGAEKETIGQIRHWIIQNRMKILRLMHAKTTDQTGEDLMTFLQHGNLAMIQEAEESIQRIISVKSSQLSDAIDSVNKTFFLLLVIACTTCCLGFLAIYYLLFRVVKNNRKLELAKQQLAINEQRFIRILHHTDNIFYVTDRRGNFQFTSEKVMQLTGYTSDELANKSYLSLIPEEWHDEVQAFYRKQVAQNELHTVYRFPIIRKDGATRWVEQSCILIQDKEKITGIQATVRDVTDTVLLEKTIEEQHFKLKSIMDYSPSIVFIKDANGRYLMVNNRFTELFGVEQEDVIGKTDFDLIDERTARRYQLAEDRVMTEQKALETEELVRLPHGNYTHISVRFPLYDHNHHLYGIGCIATDISEIAEYRKKLREDRAKAENSEKMQELFLASMSHEIRTPMNAILGLLRELKKTDLTIEQRVLTDNMHYSSDHLMVLINDILDVSKIQSGQLGIEQISFDLQDLVTNCINIISHKANENVQLVSTISNSISRYYIGDPHRIKQCLLNLLGNAIKFTTHGKISLSCTLRKTEDRLHYLELKVSDTGVGMNEEYLSRLFEKFSQEEKSTSRRFGGTGLGMFITKSLVDLMDGTIEVQSQKNKGTEFTITLPLLKDDKIIQKTAEPKAIQSTESLKDLHILLVDDNDMNRLVVTHCLSHYGPIVTEAANGEEAVELLRSQQFDIVLMDIQMPGMDGYTASQIIRKDINTTVPIIALTASAFSNQVRQYNKYGMDDYITKPFEEHELISKITYWTSGSRKMAI